MSSSCVHEDKRYSRLLKIGLLASGGLALSAFKVERVPVSQHVKHPAKLWRHVVEDTGATGNQSLNILKWGQGWSSVDIHSAPTLLTYIPGSKCFDSEGVTSTLLEIMHHWDAYLLD